MQPLRIAHISDLHFCDSANYVVKNTADLLQGWKGPTEVYHALHECKRFSTSRVRSLVAEVNQRPVDVVVATGDFTLTGKREEYALAVEVLKGLQAPLLAVPGNHDVWSEESSAEQRFVAHMAWALPDGQLPWVWDDPLGRARVVGLDSTKYTRSPLSATGVLPSESLEFLQRVGGERPAGTKLIVALHHHVLPDFVGDKVWLLRQKQDVYRKKMRLKNAEEFWEVARSVGVDLVLHGHRHKPFRREHLGTRVHCVGSGGVDTVTPGKSARFDVVEVGASSIEVTTWAWNGERWEFGT